MKINKKIIAGLTAVSMLSCGIWMESVAAADTAEPEVYAGEAEPALSEEEIFTADEPETSDMTENANTTEDTTDTSEDMTGEIPEDQQQTDTPSEDILTEPSADENQPENPDDQIMEVTEEPETPEEAEISEDPGPLTEESRTEKSGFCGAEEDNISWDLDETGTLMITGQGEMESWENEEEVPWNEFRDQITKVQVTDGVANIGDYAFANCGNLAELDLADSVQTIGAYAYFNCSGLSTLTVG